MSARNKLPSDLPANSDVWQQIFAAHHPRLLQLIRKLLGGKADSHLVQELAQRAWCALVLPPRRPVDPCSLGPVPLSAYLTLVARRLVRAFFRRRRRKTKEVPLGSYQPEDPNAIVWSIEMRCADFQATLSPQQRKLCRYELQNPAERGPCPFSPANVRKLKQHIMRKWQAYRRHG